MNFIEKLIEQIKDKKSVTCMGLDPRMNGEGQIPHYLIEELQEPNKIIKEFSKILIENVHDLIPAVKLQIAFYEKYDALRALKDTVKYAHENDLLVILDSKRNDIGSTSEAYADSTFKVYGADACTLNAYFGYDSIKPYLKYKEKGLFILVKTSNPSSKEFQDLFSVKLNAIPEAQIKVHAKDIELERNYIKMARLVNEWSKNLETFSSYHNMGVVVGATYPEILKEIRIIVKHSFILMPGYGAQGATSSDIKYGFQDDGLGGIVNSSRGIMFAYYESKSHSPRDFGKAAREKVLEMNAEINSAIRL
ncbi:MAG: orotidine-5'-phosphate decarboxylase [Promethearchaeota archaeon]